MKNIDVMWVGLSAKKTTNAEGFVPLNINTNTGKLVAEIEAQCSSINFYKTNLVKFPPLDAKQKLRYPTLKECTMCYPELQIEIRTINPRVVLLLGNKTATFIFDQLGLQMSKLSYQYQAFEHEERWYVPIHHPSYIMTYKRKEKNLYIQAVKTIIDRLVT